MGSEPPPFVVVVLAVVVLAIPLEELSLLLMKARACWPYSEP